MACTCPIIGAMPDEMCPECLDAHAALAGLERDVSTAVFSTLTNARRVPYVDEGMGAIARSFAQTAPAWPAASPDEILRDLQASMRSITHSPPALPGLGDLLDDLHSRLASAVQIPNMILMGGAGGYRECLEAGERAFFDRQLEYVRSRMTVRRAELGAIRAMIPPPGTWRDDAYNYRSDYYAHAAREWAGGPRARRWRGRAAWRPSTSGVRAIRLVPRADRPFVLGYLADRYSRDLGNRHDARRWLRAFADVAAVAHDAMESDRRAIAVEILCQLVCLEDAIRLTDGTGLRRRTLSDFVNISVRVAPAIVRLPASVSYADGV